MEASPIASDSNIGTSFAAPAPTDEELRAQGYSKVFHNNGKPVRIFKSKAHKKQWKAAQRAKVKAGAPRTELDAWNYKQNHS